LSLSTVISSWNLSWLILAYQIFSLGDLSYNILVI